MLGIDYMRLDEIRMNPVNPKDHDLGALHESFAAFGFVAPMGINEATGYLLWGHGRLKELLRAHQSTEMPPEGINILDDGMWEAPVVRGISLREEKATAYLLADNHLVELGGWDDPKLLACLQALSSEMLASTGFDESDVDRLLQFNLPMFEDVVDEEEKAGQSMDRAEEIQQEWKTEPGQLWRIPSLAAEGGAHYVYCGDCTQAGSWIILMQDALAKWMWTDPPCTDEPFALLKEAFESADVWLEDGAPLYSACPDIGMDSALTIFRGLDWHFHQQLVWVKDTMVLGHLDYHKKHEGILYGWKGRDRKWYGGRDKVTVFEINRPIRSAEHPTMKPLDLIMPHLVNSSRIGEMGIDPFLGSGSTLLAAERTGRLCRGMEIEAKYVAVALQRARDAELKPEVIR